MKIIDIVVPCYCVDQQILDVLDGILKQKLVRNVVVVDDACPKNTGKLVTEKYGKNIRVIVLTHKVNQGVGGAMCTGYEYAFNNGADIAVKMDGDGQMDPRHIPAIVKPIVDGKCDYAKGNRFYNPSGLRNMPLIRVFGNSALSLINKFTSGYWSVMDPTNGFTALHSKAYSLLEHDDLARDYFFESDMLYQLGNVRAVVRDIPLPTIYGDEESNLRISSVLLKFPKRYLKRFVKRIILRYFIREFNFASLEIIMGSLLFSCGVVFGLFKWISNYITDTSTPAGTVMIVGILIIIGFQFLLSALNYDVNNSPSIPLLDVDFDYEQVD